MSKFVRIALLVALGVVTAASAALAVVPDPTFSSCGNCLVLTPGGDPGVSFTVVVKDQFNNAINGSNVVIDFGTCPVALCSGQDVGFTKTGNTISGTTNLSGTVVFTPRGGFGTDCTIKVYADGVQICSLSHVSSPDLNGDGSVDISDLSMFAGDMVSNNLESDLNCDGSVDISDLSIFAGEMVLSGAGYCP